LTIGFSLRIQFHALIQLRVSQPSFDTAAWNIVWFLTKPFQY
jgi:hypothetical protein